MIETYEQLTVKLDRLIEKELIAEEYFVEKEVAYQEAQSVFEKESADVEKIKEESFSSFLRSMVGTYDNKLNKEKQEKIEAKVRLDTASRLMEEAREQLIAIRAQVDGSKIKLDNLRKELLAIDENFREKITEEEHKRMEWKQEIIELDEAIMAGSNVLNALDKVVESLESADSMATWDLFSDSFFLDMMKYNKIDSAEEKLFHLEGLIERYQEELKDVHMEAALHYEEHSQSSRFFDMFFDNIFSDWNTKDKIKRNINNLGEMQKEVGEIQEALIDQKIDYTEKIQASESYFKA